MPALALLLLGGSGLTTGFISALLALGGGLVLFPALLILNEHFSQINLSIDQITGLTAAGSLCSSLFSFFFFRRDRSFYKEIVYYVMPTMMCFSFLGGMTSKVLPKSVILILFIALAGTNIFNFVTSLNHDSIPAEQGPEVLRARKFLLLGFGGLIGFVCSIVGMGGAVITVSVLTRYLRLNMKHVMGSSLALSVSSFSVSVLGKALTRQIPFPMLPYIAMGILVGAPLGYRLNRRLSPRSLRLIMILFLLVVFSRALAEFF